MMMVQQKILKVDWPNFQIFILFILVFFNPSSYNKWQIPIAVLILLISGLAQFMKYKKTDNAKFISAILVSLVLSIVFTGVIAYFADFLTNIPFMLLIFASVFTILANTKILTDVLIVVNFLFFPGQAQFLPSLVIKKFYNFIFFGF